MEKDVKKLRDIELVNYLINRFVPKTEYIDEETIAVRDEILARINNK